MGDQAEHSAAVELFNIVFEQDEMGMALRAVDPNNSRWLRVNQKFCDMLGYTHEELLQLTSVDISVPDEQHLAVQYNEQFLRGDLRSYSREKRYLRKDGTAIWTQIWSSAVLDPDGNPTQIISVIQDITERKRADEALREAHEKLEQRVEERTSELNQEIQQRIEADEALRNSEARFKDFAEGASDWFWEMDEDLRFTYHSPRYFEITGYRPEDKLGTTRTRYVDPADLESDADKWAAHMEDLEARRPFKNFEFAFKAKDGATINARISGTPAFDAEGNFQGYRGTGTDISERMRAERELEESRERLRAVFDNTPVCLNLKDTEGRYILVNKPYEEWLGHPAEEIIGKKASDFLGQSEEVENLTLAEMQVLESGEVIEREVSVPRPDGAVYDRILIKFPVKSAGGSIAAIGTVAVDITDLKRIERELRDARDDLEMRVEERTRELTDEITERKSAEEGLRESENRYRALFENAPISTREEDFSKVKARIDALNIDEIDDFITYLDRHPEFVAECAGLIDMVDANEASLKLHKIDDKADFLANFTSSFSDQALRSLKDVLVAIHNGETSLEFETYVVRADGSRRDVMARWSVAPGHEISCSRILFISVDITERRCAEEALKESEERFRVAFENAPVGVALITLEGNRFKVNKALADFLGYSVEELTDTEMKSTAADFDDLGESLRLRQQILDGKITIYRNERRYRHKQGHVVWGEVSGSLFRNKDGEPEHFIAHTINITERKRVEEALREAHENLEQRIEERTSELRKAQDDLFRQERLAALGQVTATVAHELRNPLGAIRSALATIKILAQNSAPQLGEHPVLEDSLAIADRGITRCDRIIGEMLDHTRITELKRSPTRVDEWLDWRFKEYDPPATISLRRTLSSGVEISLDRDRFDRAVRNVIDNACQAFDGATTVGDGAAECQVAVATRRVGQRLEVSISDNGVGISPQTMARVFEPLYSTKAFGVGLGLPMVRQIMEQHGGGVEITSEEGRGTEVVLWLPLTTEARGGTA